MLLLKLGKCCEIEWERQQMPKANATNFWVWTRHQWPWQLCTSWPRPLWKAHRWGSRGTVTISVVSESLWRCCSGQEVAMTHLCHLQMSRRTAMNTKKYARWLALNYEYFHFDLISWSAKTGAKMMFHLLNTGPRIQSKDTCWQRQ